MITIRPASDLKPAWTEAEERAYMSIPYDLADPVQYTKAVAHIKRGGKVMIDGVPEAPPIDPPHFGVIVLHGASHAS